jgi:hypothetical protein
MHNKRCLHPASQSTLYMCRSQSLHRHVCLWLHPKAMRDGVHGTVVLQQWRSFRCCVRGFATCMGSPQQDRTYFQHRLLNEVCHAGVLQV